MNIKTLICIIFLVLFAFKGFTQTENIFSLDKDYDKYVYIDAIATFEKVANKGYKDEKMFQKLGNSYYFNGLLTQAIKWYDALFEMNEDQDPEYYYRYAQALKSVDNFDKAEKMMALFQKKSGNDQSVKSAEKNKNFIDVIKANAGRFEITNAGVNSKYSDYGSAYLDNKLVFTSTKDTGSVAKKVFQRTNQSFTNLYSVELQSDGSVGKVEKFAKKANSKFSESTPAFTKDGKTMYFTINNFQDGIKGKKKEKITLLKLYRATLADGKWEDLGELPFNSNNYNTAHPALSPDEKTLYFASDMPGGYGQSDIYSVTVNSDGSFGIPKNLGKTINTERRETFPFVSDDNELYFASDGLPGLGGLDIFAAKINPDNSLGPIKNIGEPINSKQDDFALIINSKNKNGFLSSNRKGGMGYDDIYRFTEFNKLECTQNLYGVILDLDNNTVLPYSTVNLLDDQFKIIREFKTDAEGRYNFEVECGKKYYVRVAKEKYDTKETPVDIKDVKGTKELVIALEKRIKPATINTDLAKIVDVSIIYFALNKSNITPKAAFELEKIYEVMRQYPKIKIGIRSHTDSRQTANYNLELSDKRAKATVAWLVKKGIAASRLTAKGYGESRLLNKCSDNVSCTEAEHQANRRSEFIIISMK
ncbi:OmpA family protein [Flavobacterium collinsii]|uniref:Flagellar motor protein MotB n=1 Tax=Flavobacterium collinsii TaxID=1114861 RepID=A0A9W4TIH5_9FLAO|nr:OmpA family protein [Flavobacterium collinsii]CAI2768674.1 Flagellar motor protein MotB [Flavobacterium collinsii]